MNKLYKLTMINKQKINILLPPIDDSIWEKFHKEQNTLDVFLFQFNLHMRNNFYLTKVIKNVNIRI